MSKKNRNVDENPFDGINFGGNYPTTVDGFHSKCNHLFSVGQKLFQQYSENNDISIEFFHNHPSYVINTMRNLLNQLKKLENKENFCFRWDAIEAFYYLMVKQYAEIIASEFYKQALNSLKSSRREERAEKLSNSIIKDFLKES